MSLKGPKISAGKVQIGTPDLSKLSLSQFAAAGVLTNPGISIFGASLQAGIVRAGVSIGPPGVIPGVALPASLEVTGVANIFGSLNVFAIQNSFGLKTAFGGNIKNGFSFKNSVDTKQAINIGNGPSVFNGKVVAHGTISTPLLKAGVVLGIISGTTGINKETASAIAAAKGFDIPHATKPGKRIRHVCVEGPEAAIYIRGRLKDSNVIELPEYWDGLVDYDSITVQLQPIGDRHYHLNVMEIDKDKIVVRDSDDKPIDCFYHVWVARWIDPRNHDEKLHVVYDGESPANYPGNPESFSIAGWDYDRREVQ